MSVVVGLSWSELKQACQNHDMIRLVREPNVQLQYEQHKKDVLEKFNSMSEFILDEINHEEVLKPNMFPYHLDKRIKHYIYWNPCYSFNTDVNDSDVKQHLISRVLYLYLLKDNVKDNILIHINKRENRSVPSIFHAHVFMYLCI
jgi:Protein of unknown function (DUF3605)